MSVQSNYTECLPTILNSTYVPPPGAPVIDLACCGSGGPIKYAIIGGEFPPSLYLDIDTGTIVGEIDGLEAIAPKRLGIPADFKFNETNYLKYAVSGLELRFTVRAFNSSDTSVYDDHEVVMYLRTNWSARRDRFILNIQNQFFVDGATATNAAFVKAMKSKGYYPGPGCE
jgi:hypothetical protein